MAFFPGDLPEQTGQGGDFRSIRFRPPMLEKTDDGIPALPHIRLDRALQFLIGDRLR
jgi:predicted YcjX-like family ATPase